MPAPTKITQTHPGKPLLRTRPANPAHSAATVDLTVAKKDNKPATALVQEGTKGDVQKLAPEIKKLERELTGAKEQIVDLQTKIAKMASYEKEYKIRKYPSDLVDNVWANCEDTPIAADDWRNAHHNAFIMLHPYDVSIDRAGNATSNARIDLPPVKCVTMIPSTALPREPGEGPEDLIAWRMRSYLAVWDKLDYERDEQGKIKRDAENEPIVCGVIGVPGFIDKAFFDQIVPVYETEAPIEATPEPTEANTAPTPTEAPKAEPIGALKGEKQKLKIAK